MARQLAAYTRNTSYRYSPSTVKDSTYFGINHSPQSTTLTSNCQYNTPDLSAFKTPPEGHTPVDQKHFDYDGETLRSLKVAHHNFSLSLYEKQLCDSGIAQHEDLLKVDDITGCLTNGEGGVIKSSEDDMFEYHTPPEFQGSQAMITNLHLESFSGVS